MKNRLMKMLFIAFNRVVKLQIFTRTLVNLQAQGLAALGLVLLWH